MQPACGTLFPFGRTGAFTVCDEDTQMHHGELSTGHDGFVKQFTNPKVVCAPVKHL